MRMVSLGIGTKTGASMRRARCSPVSLGAMLATLQSFLVETLTPAQVEFRNDHYKQPGLRVVIRKAQGKRKNDRVAWARSDDVWPVLKDMHNLLAWIMANATDQYWRNNPHGYLFARPSDGLLPTKFAGVFADVLDHLGLRRDPVTGSFRSSTAVCTTRPRKA